VEALSLARAAVEDIEVFTNCIVRTGFIRQLEMSADDVGDVTQNGRRTLLAIIFDIGDELIRPPRPIA